MHPGSTDLNGRKTIQPNQDRSPQTPKVTAILALCSLSESAEAGRLVRTHSQSMSEFAI